MQKLTRYRQRKGSDRIASLISSGGSWGSPGRVAAAEAEEEEEAAAAAK